MRRLVAISMLLCGSVVAQIPVIPSGFNYPPAASGLPNPTTIPGLYEYWNSADLLVGGTVSNWVGRISGIIWTNGDTARWPTNAASGVYFNGSNAALTNTLTFDNSKFGTAFLIVKCMRTSNIADGFWTDLAGVSGVGFDWSSGTVAIPNSLSELWKQPTGIFQDWIFPFENNNSRTCYTNNVQCRTGGSPIFGSVTGMKLGAIQAGGAPGNFYVSVIAIYTNATAGGDMSTNSGYRTTLHAWATNSSPSAPFSP